MSAAANSLVWFGDTVKALSDDGKVGGYLVKFSDADNPDLAGDFFTKATDFVDMFGQSAVYYQHGLDPTLGRKMLGIATLKMDDVGVWAETQLNLRNAYERAIFSMAKKGKMGWSSGTAPHLVERESVEGKASSFIKRWPLGLDASLTPNPCEPNAKAIPLKSLEAQPLSIKSEGLSFEDKRSLLENAARQAICKEECYCYVCDLYDDTVVYRCWKGDRYWYCEAPYTITGGVATLGECVEVFRRTAYDPVSGKSLSFADHLDSVLAAAKGLNIRASEVKSLREQDGRALSQERRDQIKQVADQLSEIAKAQYSAFYDASVAEELARAELLLARKALGVNPNE